MLTHIHPVTGVTGVIVHLAVNGGSPVPCPRAVTIALMQPQGDDFRRTAAQLHVARNPRRANLSPHLPRRLALALAGQAVPEKRGILNRELGKLLLLRNNMQ